MRLTMKSRLSKSGRTWRLLAVSLALSMVSIWFVFACIAYDSYQSAWREAELVSSDISLLLGEGIAREIALYDIALKAFAKNAANPDIMKLPVASRNAALFDDERNAPGLGGMLLVDKDGYALIESRHSLPAKMNLSDRPYFRELRDGTGTTQPFISHFLAGRLTAKFSIIMSRRRTSPTGAFDGVVSMAIGIDYFNHMFESVHLPPGSAITLMHRDGTILARIPKVLSADGSEPKSTYLLQAVVKGVTQPVVLQSRVDGIERLVAYQEVGPLPLYLAVGLSTKDFLGTWLFRLGIVGLGFAGLSAIILFLGIMLARELNRRTMAEDALFELAATDGLTLLANRRRFDEVLQNEWRRAVRDSTRLGLLMIDSDWFKAFNDTYGHVEGDHALRLIADTLTRAVERPGDLVARFGGEEFVVLLPSTDAAGAYTVAEAIKTAVADLAVPHAGAPGGVLTVSIGAASLWPRDYDVPASLIEAADTALYVAKAQGRNRIVVDGVAAHVDPYPPLVA